MLVPLLLLLTGPTQAGSPPLAELLTRAQQRLQATDRSGARRELAQALKLYPESPAVHNFLGVLEAQEGNYRGAEARFREATARAPQYTDAYLNLGRLYQENMGRDEAAVAKALAAYESVLQYQPDHTEANYQSAVLRQAQKDFARSLEHLKHLPPVDQERPTALAVRCADHAGRGERAEADRAAERLLARPDLAEADLQPILPTLAEHGRQDLALRLLEALRARGRASGDGLQRLGLLYESEKRLDAARQALEAAAQTRPSAVPVLLDLARVAYKERDFRGALGYLAHARDLQPGNAGVHFFFGVACMELELGAEAYNSLKEAVRLEPENPSFNYALGAAALHRRFPGEAIPFFQKYSELRPGDPRGSFGAGIAAYKGGDFVLARAELSKAAANRETTAGANYFLARMARDENDLEEALRLANKAVEAKPDYPDPYAELGLLHLRKRELDKAEQALRRCLELDPDNYLGNFHLLLLYERTKDPRQEAQTQRFEELKARHEQKADEFLRLIEVRPY